MTQPRKIDCVLNADPTEQKLFIQWSCAFLSIFVSARNSYSQPHFQTSINMIQTHTQSSTKPMNKLNDVIHNKSLIIAQTVAILSLSLSPPDSTTLFYSPLTLSHTNDFNWFNVIFLISLMETVSNFGAV